MDYGKVQWHPAFGAALHIEFQEELEFLKIEEEHMLSSKPMQMDVLIIKKEEKKRLRKNIGRIFCTYNVVEYKSPNDYLSVNDYYKVCGYACFYQSDTEKVLEILPTEITITFVCQRYPREFLRHLTEVRNMELVQAEEGIYYLKNGMFPTQIIVTKELSKEENYWLQSLRVDLKSGMELRILMSKYEANKNSKWYSAVMETIVRGNWKEMEEEKRMCEALKELFADELKESEEQGIALAKKIYKLSMNGKAISEIAEICGVSEEKVREILE